jgi:hypothetical protein
MGLGMELEAQSTVASTVLQVRLKLRQRQP